MGHRWILLAALCGLLLMPISTLASTDNLGSIIETFVLGQFPQSSAHYWIINETQWDGDEMVVDMHTIVQEKRQVAPMLNHFLLLIVAGELKGVQQVPLEPDADCQPEEET
ncbi:MAG TPA: hypothetical protein VIR79_00290 [Nitrospira sp.]